MKLLRLISILQCPNCKNELIIKDEMVFCLNCNNEIKIIDGIIRFYDINNEYIVPVDNIASNNPKKWTQWRQNNFLFYKNEIGKINKNAMVLDLGAGSAPFSSLFEKNNTCTVDIQPFSTIDIVTDINRSLPFNNNSFDIVILSNVLEHIPNPKKLLLEINRVIKPNGKLILTVPFMLRIHQEPYDYLRYTDFMLEHLLKSTQFSEIKIVTIGSVLDVYMQIYSSILKTMRNISHLKHKIVIIKIVNKLYMILFKILIKITKVDEIFKVENNGYPQGYGVVAIKR